MNGQVDVGIYADEARRGLPIIGVNSFPNRQIDKLKNATLTLQFLRYYECLRVPPHRVISDMYLAEPL